MILLKSDEEKLLSLDIILKVVHLYKIIYHATVLMDVITSQRSTTNEQRL